jgi:hypothetical protein
LGRPSFQLLKPNTNPYVKLRNCSFSKQRTRMAFSWQQLPPIAVVDCASNPVSLSH